MTICQTELWYQQGFLAVAGAYAGALISPAAAAAQAGVQYVGTTSGAFDAITTAYMFACDAHSTHQADVALGICRGILPSSNNGGTCPREQELVTPASPAHTTGNGITCQDYHVTTKSGCSEDSNGNCTCAVETTCGMTVCQDNYGNQGSTSCEPII
jgi:hypothetical protein